MTDQKPTDDREAQKFARAVFGRPDPEPTDDKTPDPADDLSGYLNNLFGNTNNRKA